MTNSNENDKLQMTNELVKRNDKFKWLGLSYHVTSSILFTMSAVYLCTDLEIYYYYYYPSTHTLYLKGGLIFAFFF